MRETKEASYSYIYSAEVQIMGLKHYLGLLFDYLNNRKIYTILTIFSNCIEIHFDSSY